MSSLSDLRVLDAAIHAGLRGVGGADVAFYTAPGSNVDVECSVYLDRDAQPSGLAGQIAARHDEMRIVTGDGLDLRQGGRVFIEDVAGSGAGDIWSLDKKLGDDGSLSLWSVRRV